MKGTVKFFNREKAFGFITGEDGKDYFVHQSGLEEGVSIDENDPVQFEVVEGDRGPKAVNVSKGSDSVEETSEDSESDEDSENSEE